MRKSLLLIILNFSLYAQTDQLTLDDFKKLKPLDHAGVKLLSFEKKDKLYMIHADVLYMGQHKFIDVFVTQDLKQVIFGNAFYTKDGEQIRTPFNTKNLVDLVAFKQGSGSDKYFVFTSPGCSACNQLNKLIKEKGLKENITLYTLMYPIKHFKNAYKEASYLLEQPIKDRELIYSKIMQKTLKIDKKFKASKKVKKIIIKSKNLANQLNITGTQFILNQKGKKVDWDTLLKGL